MANLYQIIFSYFKRRQMSGIVFCGDDLDGAHPITGTTSSNDPFSFSVVFTTSSEDNSNTDEGFSLLLIGLKFYKYNIFYGQSVKNY